MYEIVFFCMASSAFSNVYLGMGKVIFNWQYGHSMSKCPKFRYGPCSTPFDFDVIAKDAQ